jgi:hypothetical protein
MVWNKENVIGKRICASIIYLDGIGGIVDRVQNYGTISYADDEIIEYELIEFSNANDNVSPKDLSNNSEKNTFTIPAYYESLEPTDPNLVYILDNTGEVVRNIDITATFTVVPQKDEENEFGPSESNEYNSLESINENYSRN